MESEIITLGKCSNFLMIMLGDFCSQNGMSTKIQKDYKDENTKAAFGKYNFADGESTLSKIKCEFHKIAFLKYKGISRISSLMLHFPAFLQQSIKYSDPRILEYFSEQQVIIFLLSQYVVFHYKTSESNEKQFFKNILPVHITNTYNDIFKETKVNIKTLDEKCKWTSLEEVLIAANTQGVYESEEELLLDCMVLVQHYIFLGFKEALKEVFNFDDEKIHNFEVWIVNEIDNLAANQDYYIQNYSTQFYEYMQLPFDNSENVIFSLFNIDCDAIKAMFYTEEEWFNKEISGSLKHIKESFLPGFKDRAIIYFINSHSRITKLEADEYIKTLESINDEYYNKIIIPWYKARISIFSLTFTDKKKDKELKEEACVLFRDTFNNYKYLIGSNLPEFLSDAIACDVYCNPKKDIFDNAQDDTDESSIIMPGKAYWEFGYALDIFDADSKKTYLLTFNAELNFWNNFPPTKFENQEKAFEVFYNETKASEFEFPQLLKDFNDPIKIDNLGSNDRKDLRQPLGNRYYSNLSIRCLKAKLPDEKMKGPSDFLFIRNYINKNQEKSDLLFTNDENGANALLRSLNRYKMLSYGYTDEGMEERARAFSDYHNNLYQGQFKYITKNCHNDVFGIQNTKGLYDYLEKCKTDFLNDIALVNKKAIQKAENTKEEREGLQSEIKDNIIFPLIKNAGKHILDEAIILDGRKCVSALQLAIDSFDYEIAQAIVDNLPKGTDLSKVYISSEYVTPLQYAVRKYDYLMQYSEMFFYKEHSIGLLEKRDIHSRKKVDRGILDYDKDFSSSQDVISHFIETFPREECGLYLTSHRYEDNKNIISVQQKNLIDIIKLLAQNTNPISVDTFYYLADIIDPNDGHVFNDIYDVTKILIDTGHADLCGTDFEWERIHWEPTQTLLSYCINHIKKDGDPTHLFQQKNYDMLAFLLGNYPEHFKAIINNTVIGIDNEGNLRRDTDLHYFITNQLESIKAWNNPEYAFDKNMKDKKFRDNYGKQIAYRMNLFLTLFQKAGASFDIPDQNGKTVKDILIEWKDKFPKDAIPEGIL